MIVQEAGTIPSIPVADNVFLGHEELFARGPFVNHAKMVKQAQVLLDELGIPIDASIRTGQLDLQQCKLIEIAKAMYWKPKILIVDETTTALSQTGRELLYKLMHKLADEGSSVMFISHDLDELILQCDAVTVLRDGNIIGSLDKEEFDSEVMKKMMVGREVKEDYYRSDNDPWGEEVVLKADCITTRKNRSALIWNCIRVRFWASADCRSAVCTRWEKHYSGTKKFWTVRCWWVLKKRW